MTLRAGNKQRLVQSRAFSLTELLVVVAIMGIMAGAAALSLRGLRAPALNNAVNETASALKLARQMAVTSRKKQYLVIPIAPSPLLSSNLFRSYAIFEELAPEDTSSDGLVVNDTNTYRGESIWVPRTDWRVLPEGVVFCNLTTSGYSSMAGDTFRGGFQLGQPLGRTPQFNPQPPDGEEWKFFMSFTNLRVVLPSREEFTLSSVPYLGFSPSGKAFFTRRNENDFQNQAALRLTEGNVVQGTQIAVTKTNNYFYIETDRLVGRIRVRTKESYRQ